MLNPTQQNELRQLVSGVCDSSLSTGEFDRLQQWIGDDGDALEFYVQYLDLHTSLAWEISTSVTRTVERPAKVSWWRSCFDATWDSYKQPLPLALTVATLVMAIIVLGLALIVPSARDRLTGNNDRVAANLDVGRLTDMHEVVWADDANAIETNSVLKSGQRLALKRGVVEITYLEGARITFEGPGVFTLDGYGAGTVERGRAVSFVPRRAVGFIINTPVAQIVDMGTEFGVAVAGDGETDVRVYQGEVSVKSREHPGDGRVVRAGESRRITVAGRVVEADTEPNFVRSIHQSHSRFEPLTVVSYEYLGDDSEPRTATHTAGSGYFDDDRILLTDRALGTRIHKDGRWVGWFDKHSLPSGDSGVAQPAIVFDLGQPVAIASIQVAYLVEHDLAIRAPDRLIVSLSKDGKTFVQAAEFAGFNDSFTASGPTGDDSGVPRIAEIKLADQPARYVRLEFVNEGQWTFLSEVLFMPPDITANAKQSAN